MPTPPFKGNYHDTVGNCYPSLLTPRAKPTTSSGDSVCLFSLTRSGEIRE